MSHLEVIDIILSQLVSSGNTDSHILSNLIDQHSINISKKELIDVVDEIEESMMFDIKNYDTKDGKDLILSVNKNGRSIYKKFGTYSKFKQAHMKSDEEILDLIFEELKNSLHGIVLDNFLKEHNILYDDKDLLRIYRLIKSTEFIKDKSVTYQSGATYFFEINELGFSNLNKKKYSEYVKRNSSNSNSTIQYYINNLSGVINNGSNNQFNNYVNITNKESLKERLADVNIDKQDIDDLLIIIDDDNRNDNKSLGPKTNDWIQKMIGKSLDGSWDVGISVAGGLLVELIKSYLNIK